MQGQLVMQGKITRVSCMQLLLLTLYSWIFYIVSIDILFHRDFDKFYNPIHGNCYIFNSGWNPDKDLYISRNTGRRYGKFESIT